MGGVEAAAESSEGLGAAIGKDNAVVRRVQRRQEREPRSAEPSDRGQVHLPLARDTTIALADVGNVRCGREEYGLGEEADPRLGVRGALPKLIVRPAFDDAAPDDHDVVFRRCLFSQAEVPHEWRPFVWRPVRTVGAAETGTSHPSW